MKKVLWPIVVGALTCLVSTAFAAPSNPSFSDIEGHWAKKEILNAIAEKYVDGYPDGTFGPDAAITRAEFLKMIVAGLNFQTRQVSEEQPWYRPYTDAAVANGIHQYEEFYDDAAMNSAIPRDEVARMAVRATGQANYSPSKWMYLATSKGLIQGMDATGTLGEFNVTTRAQAITVIERIKKIRSGETLPTDKHAVSRAEVAWHGTNLYTMWPRYFSAKFMDSYPFDLSKFKYDASDGIYHEEVLYYVVVDMEDPNDPYRSEIEDVEFYFNKKFNPAPKQSYVTYAKIKQVIDGKYPSGMYLTEGGKIHVSIVPKDAASINRASNWEDVYKSKEDDNTIFFTKLSGGEIFNKLMQAKGYNPIYSKNLPDEGGTYYWISAEVHPKGEFYSEDRNSTYVSYRPSAEYGKVIGPQIAVNIEGIADYTISNP